MSISEMTALAVFGLSAVGIIITTIVVLVNSAIKQAAEAAKAKQSANQNAQAIKQLQKATDIIVAPVSDQQLIDSLRDGNF